MSGHQSVSQGTDRSRVDASLDEVHQNVVQLHEALGSLENRLSGVLGPEPNQVSGPAGESKSPTQIADRITQHGNGVVMATKRIHSMIGRLEL